MTGMLSELLSRRRFGMKPGLDSMRMICAELGNPQQSLRAVHVAGTNGKGAVCAILDACLAASGQTTGRYTSPHLLSVNERFCLNGSPVDDETLAQVSDRVCGAIMKTAPEATYFEALTAVAFLLFAERHPDWTLLECGLGGRLDATNVCTPSLCVITRIGLDHCDWLGSTIEAIAAEKAGIVKPGIPVVLGRNEPSVRTAVERRADELGAPFLYAPDMADASELPPDLSLPGRFNRENAVTALAALKALARHVRPTASLEPFLAGFSRAVWPGRFQRIGDVIVDGAHNPPAAAALADALREDGAGNRSMDLVAGFCGDKDADSVLRTLAPLVRRAFAVHTGNPRSLSAAETARRMRRAGIDASSCVSLAEALSAAGRPTLVCGSLFLAGLALAELGACPWQATRHDPSELLTPPQKSAGR